MELEQLRKRLEHLDHGQDELNRGQAEMLRRIADVANDLRKTLVEIGGVPDDIGRDPNRQSIRARLHKLENDRTTARVAATAVDAAKELRAASAEKRFTKREKTVGLVLALIVAIGPYVAPFLHH